MHQTTQGHMRAIQLDSQRAKIRLLPGTVVLLWLVRHAGWSARHDQPRNDVRQTADKHFFGKQYDGKVMKLGEVAMGRTPL